MAERLPEAIGFELNFFPFGRSDHWGELRDLDSRLDIIRSERILMLRESRRLRNSESQTKCPRQQSKGTDELLFPLNDPCVRLLGRVAGRPDPVTAQPTSTGSTAPTPHVGYI